MSIQNIRLFGDPVLRTPAEPVVDFDRELRQLVAGPHRHDGRRPGAGLAAPQLGVGLRVFTYWVDGVLGHLVNPDLDALRRAAGGRGGLPVVPRPALRDAPGAARSSPRASTSTASRSSLEGSELLARCLQHETDHLDGILFIDRMDREQRKLAMRAIREARVGRCARHPTVRVSPHATFGRGM